MVALIDMTGLTINGVMVIAKSGCSKGKASWTCACPCGETFQSVGTRLRSGQVRGCPACAKKSMVAAATKHGGVGSREYGAYRAMLQRCYYEKDKRYPRYGGRGIRVCEAWLQSFAFFLKDMGPQPSPQHSIERLDRDKNYAPDNCCWATRIEQANNRSNNTRIEIGGRTQNLTQWSREAGVHRTVILRRMQRGISGEALLSKGVIQCKR